MLVSRRLLRRLYAGLCKPIQRSSQPLSRSSARKTFGAQVRSMAQQQHQSNNEKILTSIAKNIVSSVQNDLQEEHLVMKFNLTRDILEHLKIVSDDTQPHSKIEESLLVLKENLNDFTMGMLEEIFSGSQSDNKFSAIIKCHGCGAVLQCSDRLQPGFISSEHVRLDMHTLRATKCKRCSAIDAYDIALSTNIAPQQFKRFVAKQIKSNKNSAILVMVDLTDLTEQTLPSLLEGTIHKFSQIILVGNKFDLLPPDAKGYDERIVDLLRSYSKFLNEQVKKIRLISAKTGYGVEELISEIQNLWKSRRDLYLIGAVNVGKSTLFNTLLQSDLGKGKTLEVFQKATVSKWPGTTLNTLKFPLEQYTAGQLRARQAIVKARNRSEERLDLGNQEYATGAVERNMLTGLCQLRTGQQFRSPFEFSPASAKSLQLAHNQRWVYDTPGILNDESSILPWLNQIELQQVIPTRPYVPRIFSLLPHQALSFGALGRIEYVKGTGCAMLFVFSCPAVPVVVATIDETVQHFSTWLKQGKLQVPSSIERYRELGSFQTVCQNWTAGKNAHVVSDIIFASAGWMSLMLPEIHQETELRISCLHSLPTFRFPLLPHIYRLKGKRLRGTPKYEVRKDYDKLFTQGKLAFVRGKRATTNLPLPSHLADLKKLFN